MRLVFLHPYKVLRADNGGRIFMYEIRYAAMEDARALGEIHAASWQAAYRGIVPDEVLKNMTAAKREEYFREALSCRSEEDALLLVDSKPAGFLCLGKCRDADAEHGQGEIWGIYLHPAYWRQGMGTRLLHWGLCELKNRGYHRATLWVLAKNISARRFYEKMGFLPDGTEKQIVIGKSLTECRYWISLSECKTSSEKLRSSLQ